MIGELIEQLHQVSVGTQGKAKLEKGPLLDPQGLPFLPAERAGHLQFMSLRSRPEGPEPLGPKMSMYLPPTDSGSRGRMGCTKAGAPIEVDFSAQIGGEHMSVVGGEYDAQRERTEKSATQPAPTDESADPSHPLHGAFAVVDLQLRHFRPTEPGPFESGVIQTLRIQTIESKPPKSGSSELSADVAERQRVAGNVPVCLRGRGVRRHGMKSVAVAVHIHPFISGEATQCHADFGGEFDGQ